MNQDLRHLRMQRTIASAVDFVGIGLHSGQRVKMRIQPTAADKGITFIRSDLPVGENRFSATYNAAVQTGLGITLGNPHGHRIDTVEHLLSALFGLGIDNAKVILDGPEVPAMDGSSLPFVEALGTVGIEALPVARDLLVVRRPVRLEEADRWAELLPDVAPRLTISIDFLGHEEGRQQLSLSVSPANYIRELAPARTFGFAGQLSRLKERGRALGGSVRNAVLVTQGRVTNPEGLRFPDEFVRHKALDVLGDLALAQFPIIGHYRADRPGHRLNIELIQLLMHDRQSWQLVAASDLLDDQLRGPDCWASPVGEEAPTSSASSQDRPTSTSRWASAIDRFFNKDEGERR